MRVSSSLSMLQVPLGQIFLLTNLATCKVFWILSLLEWMPVVENPVWWDDFTLKSNTAGRHRELSWLSMLFKEQFFLSFGHQSLDLAIILHISVLVEAGTHHNCLIAISRSATIGNLCFGFLAYIIFVNITNTVDSRNNELTYDRTSFQGFAVLFCTSFAPDERGPGSTSLENFLKFDIWVESRKNVTRKKYVEWWKTATKRQKNLFSSSKKDFLIFCTLFL